MLRLVLALATVSTFGVAKADSLTYNMAADGSVSVATVGSRFIDNGLSHIFLGPANGVNPTSGLQSGGWAFPLPLGAKGAYTIFLFGNPAPSNGPFQLEVDVFFEANLDQATCLNPVIFGDHCRLPQPDGTYQITALTYPNGIVDTVNFHWAANVPVMLPEPGTVCLLLTALLGCAALTRKL